MGADGGVLIVKAVELVASWPAIVADIRAAYRQQKKKPDKSCVFPMQDPANLPQGVETPEAAVSALRAYAGWCDTPYEFDGWVVFSNGTNIPDNVAEVTGIIESAVWVAHNIETWT